MMDYTGHACPRCNKPFTPADDIVVCPECGAPYHRSCYEAEGHCLFEGMHSPEFAWKPAPSEAAPVVCPRCGAGNAESAVFCNHCGARLQEPEDDGEEGRGGQGAENGPYDYSARYAEGQGADGPYGGMDEEGFFGPFGQLFTPGETLCGIPVQTWAAFLGASSPYYLLNFKRMELTGRRLSVSFSAFVLGPIYFFYRKMYKWGFVFAALSLLLDLPNLLAILIESGSAVTGALTLASIEPLLNVAWVLSWVMMVVRSMVALWLYRDTALGRIQAIQQRWQDAGSQRAALNALGGTSIGAAIAYGVISSLLLGLVVLRLAGPGLYSMYASYLL